MTRTQRWLTGIAVASGVVVSALVVTASALLPSDEKIAAQLSAELRIPI